MQSQGPSWMLDAKLEPMLALFVNSQHKNFQVAGLDTFLYSQLHRMNVHTTTNLYGWNYKAVLLANLWWGRGTEIPSRSEESAHHPIVPILVVCLIPWECCLNHLICKHRLTSKWWAQIAFPSCCSICITVRLKWRLGFDRFLFPASTV